MILAAIAVFATVNADDGNNGNGTTKGAPPVQVSDSGIAAKGSQAPDFDLAALRGRGRVKLSDYAGKPLIVNFWASYCIPCRKEFPTFAAMQKKHRADGLEIVGITFKDLPDDARRFAKEHGATWTLAEGGDSDATGKAYGIRAIPQTFFIDRHGTIVSRFYGAPPNDRFEAEVQKILAS